MSGDASGGVRGVRIIRQLLTRTLFTHSSLSQTCSKSYPATTSAHSAPHALLGLRVKLVENLSISYVGRQSPRNTIALKWTTCPTSEVPYSTQNLYSYIIWNVFTTSTHATPADLPREVGRRARKSGEGEWTGDVHLYRR